MERIGRDHCKLLCEEKLGQLASKSPDLADVLRCFINYDRPGVSALALLAGPAVKAFPLAAEPITAIVRRLFQHQSALDYVAGRASVAAELRAHGEKRRARAATFVSSGLRHQMESEATGVLLLAHAIERGVPLDPAPVGTLGDTVEQAEARDAGTTTIEGG